MREVSYTHDWRRWGDDIAKFKWLASGDCLIYSPHDAVYVIIDHTTFVTAEDDIPTVEASE